MSGRFNFGVKVSSIVSPPWGDVEELRDGGGPPWGVEELRDGGGLQNDYKDVAGESCPGFDLVSGVVLHFDVSVIGRRDSWLGRTSLPTDPASRVPPGPPATIGPVH